MTLLVAILWPAVAAAVLLGGLVGAFAGMPRDRFAVAAGVILATIAALLGGIAVIGAVGGRAGLWIEIAAFCLGAYLAGCVVGAVLRKRPSIDGA